MKNIPQQYDEIYLQACISDSDRDDLAWHGVTWSSDLIHQDDVKYLLATPEREVAAELLEVLRTVAPYVGHYHENLAKIVGDAYDSNPLDGLLAPLGFFSNLDRANELRDMVSAAIAPIIAPDMT